MLFTLAREGKSCSKIDQGTFKKVKKKKRASIDIKRGVEPEDKISLEI